MLPPLAGCRRGVDGPPPANGWWPYGTTSARTPLGTGSHVGTAQSTSIYGGTNTTPIFATNTMTRVRQMPATPFNSLLVSQAKMRDLHAARPDVPIHPWVAPKFSDWGTPLAGSWLNAGGSDMWQENVYHAALATATQTFLWWRPGANRPEDLGMALMAEVLAELDGVLGGGGGAGGATVCAGATPIVDDTTALLGADDPYLLSGTSLRCSNGTVTTATTTRRVYRLTPRCFDARGCSTRPKVTSGARATIKIGSGFEVTPVADGCWHLPAANASSAGYWIVAPCAAHE